MLVQEMAIVICGVGAGLGRKVAAAALRDGANIVIAGRNANSLTEQTKSLEATGEHILAVATDVSDEAPCIALMEAATERFGAVDGIAEITAN